MHELNVLAARDRDAVRREFQHAMDDDDLDRAQAIARANPDLFVGPPMAGRRREDPWRDEGGEA